MGGITKMSWFKTAKDFSERNFINNKIRTLEDMKRDLDYLGKLIFQSGTNAKNGNLKIVTSKEITSFPLIHDILIEADEVALDSPWKFQDLCKQAVGYIVKEINSLKKQREDFINGGEKKVKKGLI